MMAADSQRVDGLLHELDTTRQQLREKTQVSERLLLDTTAKTEELKVLPRIMKDLEECRVNFAALQKQIQHEQSEKVQLSTQLDQMTTALDTARSDLRQRDQSLQTAVADNARLTRDVSELAIKADSIEHISRDNERLKGSVARLETENLSFSHKVSELKRELERAVEESGRISSDREAVKDGVRTLQSKLEGALDQIEASQVQMQSERERRSAAEAALAETRAVLSQCRDEIQSERAAKIIAEKRAEQCEDSIREVRSGLGQACVMSFNAMQDWDESLSAVLDGELFGSVLRGGAAPMLGTPFRQMQSPAHSAFRSPSRSGVSSSTLLNEERGVEQLLSVPTDQLLQRVAVRVERVGLKLQRTEKIRSFFVAQAEKLVDVLQQGMLVSQERMTLYQHKVAEAEAKLHKLKSTVQRDRKQRDEETQELMQFKDVVLSQHTAQLRDSEIRFAQVTQQLEHEKARSDELQRQVATQSEELRSLHQINQRMHEDLEVLERTERIVGDLSSRAGELGELNRALSKDIDAKTEAVAQLTHENGELKYEHSSLVARTESLLQQVRSRDDAIEASEAKLQGLMREMERLKARQIHPDLAKTILDTQNILQTAVRGGGASTALPSSAVAPVHTRASTGDKVGEYLSQVEQLENSAAELIRRTSEMVAGFEAHMSGSRSTMTRGAAALSSLKQEVYELLDANSNLAVQVQQVAAEFKKSIRQLNLSLSSQESQRPDADSAYAVSRRAPVSPPASYSAAPRNGGLQSDARSPGLAFGSMSLHSPAKLDGVIEPQYTSSIRGNKFSSTQRMGSSEAEFSQSLRAPTSPDAFGSTTKSARFHSTPSAAAAASTFDLPSRIAGYQPASSLSASMATYTPNTASRLSTSRLNKLGSDLDALARKLDSYDTSRK
jgi:chromosome segregation ATPase